MPIGTDQLIVSEIARRIAADFPLQTYLLPTWPLGTSAQYVGQAGAVSLRNETLWAVVRDIVLSLCDHNILFVAVINNHGSTATPNAYPVGNLIVKTAVRQLNYETPKLSAIWLQPFAVGREILKALFSLVDQEVQLDVVETAILLHLAPTLVGPLPPGGVWGKTSEASAEKGRFALEAVVKVSSEYIEHSFYAT